MGVQERCRWCERFSCDCTAPVDLTFDPLRQYQLRQATEQAIRKVEGLRIRFPAVEGR